MNHPNIPVDYGNKPILPNRFYMDARLGLTYVTGISPSETQIRVALEDSCGIKGAVIREGEALLMHLSNTDLTYHMRRILAVDEWIEEKARTLAKSPVKRDMTKAELRKYIREHRLKAAF